MAESSKPEVNWVREFLQTHLQPWRLLDGEGKLARNTVTGYYEPLIKASRKRRIAAGSGASVQEVNRLLKQFEDMRDMMKRMNKMGQKGMMRGGLASLLPQGRRPF